MILELVDVRITPGRNADFEAAVRRGLDTVIGRARGFQRAALHRGIESPERYVLQIVWDRLEDHTVAFREGPAFAQWRAIVGPFFAAPPAVEHFDFVAAP